MCWIGRDHYDANHPTCVSCRKQGVACRKPKAATKRPPLSSGVAMRDGGPVLICETDLRTPNDWNNKLNAQKIYMGEKRKWVRLFRNIFYIWGAQQEGSRRVLEVTRRVPDRRFLIKDFGNRVFTLKPLEDALKEAGVIIDDSEDFLESVPPIQVVDNTLKSTVVEVRLTEVPHVHT